MAHTNTSGYKITESIFYINTYVKCTHIYILHFVYKVYHTLYIKCFYLIHIIFSMNLSILILCVCVPFGVVFFSLYSFHCPTALFIPFSHVLLSALKIDRHLSLNLIILLQIFASNAIIIIIVHFVWKEERNKRWSKINIDRVPGVIFLFAFYFFHW